MTINPSDYPVLQAADEVWTQNPEQAQYFCNLYVFHVAAALGVSLPKSSANKIIDYMLDNPEDWQDLGKNPAQAVDLANRGYFVLAGKKELGEDGHVAVVVPMDTAVTREFGPRAYWGRLHGMGRVNETLSKAWISPTRWESPEVVRSHPREPGAPAPLDEVRYFARPLAPKFRVRGRLGF